MTCLGIIPARFASTRFPGKPLIDIQGKSMIQRVYEQSRKAKRLKEVVVATDDERIFDHVKSFGGHVIMTATHHESGTERCAEAARLLGGVFDVIINIQGDEPFIDPEQIDLLCACFQDPETDIATLIKPIKDTEELFNPNRPKVDVDDHDFARMFSRSAIPVLDLPEEKWLENHVYFKHIGIYGYRSHVLAEICQLNPTPLEQAERLEQLRWLENGYHIKTAVTHVEAIAIDTPEDLAKIAFK
ncbi:MAG: 3-deoxy-manno-octulosonate cytidylyltransferase [Flavobacteriales bacterium]|nr:3-deoxy-manno-octulosonate cytidylyltransferase [Flavobacteriales bacterium]